MKNKVNEVLDESFYDVFSELKMSDAQRFDSLYYILYESQKEVTPLEELKKLCEDNYPIICGDDSVNSSFCKLSVMLVLKDYKVKSDNSEIVKLLQTIAN